MKNPCRILRLGLLMLMVGLLLPIWSVAKAEDPNGKWPDDYVPGVPFDGGRQGGDTIDSATVIPGLPYSNVGNTCSYINDYDEVCPYTGSTSPDVVYAYQTGADEMVDITLCANSSYDTKLYVYQDVYTPGNPFACNDDECPNWVSELVGLSLTGGHTYYIVVDGYGGDCGDYTFDMLSYPTQETACCFDGVCAVLPPETCGLWGGSPMSYPTCQPNPCVQQMPGACCFGPECVIMYEEECMNYPNATWDGYEACQPNPCPLDVVLGPPCPPGGLDQFDNTTAAFLFDAPGLGLGRRPIIANGPTTVLRRVRQFNPDGSCDIQTEMLELSLTGLYNPDCINPAETYPVTIYLDPTAATLGTIRSSQDGLGNPAFPDDSSFDVGVIIDIEGVGQFPYSVSQLGNLLNDGDLWGDPPCVHPSDPYRPPSNDHAHIPCPEGNPPTGCCVFGASEFVTNQVLCEAVGGTYLGDNVQCDCVGPTEGACCFDEICAVLAREDCDRLGGLFNGYPTCQPNPCRDPQIPGACCFPGGGCQVMLEADCMNASGDWDGAPECQPNPCPLDDVQGPPCPPGGLDQFDDTHAAFLFDAPGMGLGPRPILANGPTTVLRRVRIFDPNGPCEIQTEMLQLDLTGVYNPDCIDPAQSHPVTITLDPALPTLGTILSSDDGGGNPAFPDDSFFDVSVLISIEGVGQFPYTVAGLGNLLNDGDLWGDPPCVHPSDPYRPPSNDHAHIPCPEGNPPTGCCVFGPTEFMTTQVLCEAVGGTYLGDGVQCDCVGPTEGACCFDEVCAVLPMEDCERWGGVFTGYATCSPNPCRNPQVPGACCFGPQCAIMLESDCMNAGGDWDGAPECQPNPCPQDDVLGPPCPPGGLDQFDDTHAAFLFDPPGAGLGPRAIIAHGPTTILRRVRIFDPNGPCEIQTEMLQLDLTGVFNPDCRDSAGSRNVTISLDPQYPTLGAILSSGDGAGNPDFPDDSFFDVYVQIDIEGLGVFPYSVSQLGNLLNDGDLWGDPPCVHPSDPYRPPSNDHAHIPCPPEPPPTGCCVLRANEFHTTQVLCEALGGSYLGDGVQCPSGCVESAGVDDGILDGFTIGNITPNPSTGSVQITYRLDANVETVIRIYDASGRLVRWFPKRSESIGSYQFVWDGKDNDGRDLPGGVYFLALQAGKTRTTRGIVLMR